jgi:hypothetical protein
MKRLTTSFIIMITMVLSLNSCKNKTTNIEVPPEINLEGLTLNNSEKWVANADTHIGMKHIDSILKNNTIYDGKVLGELLSKETSYIIKSCNMTGEAHDKLHIVLVPILEEITDIKDSTATAKLEQKITNLKGLINTYFKFFKT